MVLAGVVEVVAARVNFADSVEEGTVCSGGSEAPRTVSACLLLRLWRAPARPRIFFPPRKSSFGIKLTSAIKI